MNDLNNKKDPSPRPEKDTSKDRIINAALEEFSKYGLAGARVDRIARIAGINKAMIYYHFNSKDNLYREMIKSFFTRITGEINRRLNITGTLIDVLTGIAEIYTHLLSTNTPIRSILLRELANPDSEIIEQIAGVLMESQVSVRLRSLFEEGVNRGELRKAQVGTAV